MSNFAMTREEHTRAVLEAIEETRKITQTKEGAQKFLIDAGICKAEDFKPKAKSKTKKSK